MKSYISQYKLLFYFTWIGTCLIFPSWALPISVPARFAVFTGLIIYFSISAYVMNLWLVDIPVDKPLIRDSEYLSEYIRNNSGLFIVCCIAIAIHLYPLSFPVSLSYDEPTHLQSGLGLYVYINDYWHKLFDFPIQYAFWLLTGLTLILINQKTIKDLLSVNISTKFSEYKSNSSVKIFLIFFMICLFMTYFLFLRNLPYHPGIVRFPPIGKTLYLISYFFLGINEIGPRILQVALNILGTIYLYRTIKLLRDKETALLGASIFLFSPLIFMYAHRAELASGGIFFIIAISYYFLRFILTGDKGAILLSSLFISLGFLYKRTIFLMIFVCIGYLIIQKAKNRDFHLTRYLKIYLFSLVPVIPWIIIGKFFVWRKYEIIWSHFTSFDKVVSYLLILPSQITWILYLLLIFSTIYAVINKRDSLSLFFGLVFLAYYLFFTADMYKTFFRYSMAFYPTIAVFLAQFITDITRKIKWKHSFKTVFSVLTLFLILMCTIWHVQPLDARYITYRNIESRYFPISEAMKWVKLNVQDNEKILILHVPPAFFYRDKYKIERNKIVDMWYNLDAVNTPEKLHAFCKINDISHIMFSYGPAKNINYNNEVIEYLIANRGNTYTEASKFNMDGNYIFVYKLKNTQST